MGNVRYCFVANLTVFSAVKKIKNPLRFDEIIVKRVTQCSVMHEITITRCRRMMHCSKQPAYVSSAVVVSAYCKYLKE